MAIATFLIVRWVITLFSLSDKCSSSYFLLLYSTYEVFGMGYRGWTFQPAVCYLFVVITCLLLVCNGNSMLVLINPSFFVIFFEFIGVLRNAIEWLPTWFLFRNQVGSHSIAFLNTAMNSFIDKWKMMDNKVNKNVVLGISGKYLIVCKLHCVKSHKCALIFWL